MSGSGDGGLDSGNGGPGGGKVKGWTGFGGGLEEQRYRNRVGGRGGYHPTSHT